MEGKETSNDNSEFDANTAELDVEITCYVNFTILRLASRRLYALQKEFPHLKIHRLFAAAIQEGLVSEEKLKERLVRTHVPSVQKD